MTLNPSSDGSETAVLPSRAMAWLPFLGVLFVALGLPVPSPASPPKGQPVAASSTNVAAPEPQTYMRVTKPDPDTVALEIALRRFVPATNGGPMIWLAGAVHLGESNYYAGLQMFLDAQPLVLFEGIGAGSKKSRAESADDDGGIQGALAASLGLAFQLSAIDYDRASFRNSDLGIAQLQTLLLGSGSVTSGGDQASGKTTAAGEQFEQLLGAMEGSSMLGVLLHAGVKFIGSSAKLCAMTRLLLIETMGELKGDLAQMKGAPPEIQRLLAVIIHERNKTVMEDLKKAIGSTSPPASTAVFYGAGHMADFEKRLREELHYRPAGEVWLRAMAVNTREAGLSATDIGAMRSLIQWQLKLLEGSEE